jgi:hypothetical protein
MSQEKLNIDVHEEFSINIFENSSLSFNRSFEKFNIEKLVLNIFGLEYTDQSEYFSIKYSYSYDRISWSNKVKRENWIYENGESVTTNQIPIYVCVYFEKNETDIENIEPALKLREEMIKRNDEFLVLQGIKYDNMSIDIKDEEKIIFLTEKQTVNKYPKWNFYKNQNVNVSNYLDYCVSIAQMFGHVCVYFKTESTETNETLSNNYVRDVISIKKQLIISIANEIPQDRNVYERENDWTLEGDFVVHVVDSLFKGAFGENKIPLTKDYLYFPMINKLFRVNSAQPKMGVMGVIGIWELFLVKYEDDETINISDGLKDIYSGFGEFNDGINLIDEINEFNSDTKLSKEKIVEKTIEEKKKVTSNFSNRLVDSTSFIDVKETDAQREFYNNRLDIVSINPDSSSFPVMMYNCEPIEKRNIALTYNLNELVSLNKFSTLVDELNFSYDFVLLDKFVGEVVDFIGVNENPLITIQIDRRKKKTIVFSNYQFSLLIDYEFLVGEYYKVELKFLSETHQVTVKITMLENGKKVIKYQDLKIINSEFKNKIEIGKIYLYGGKYYIGKIKNIINNEIIVNDVCKPILLINNKGRN